MRLPAAIDVTGFGLDPTNTCGDDERRLDARLQDRDVVRRQLLHHRGRGHVLRRAPRQPPPPAHRRRNVRYVRLTLLSALDAGSAVRRLLRADGLRRSAEHAAVRLAGGQPRGPAHGWHGRLRRLLHRPRLAHRRLRLGLRRRRRPSIARPARPRPRSRTRGPATFAPAVAVRDFRGGAGTATRAITVTATRKPVVKLPRRGRRGKATARVKCAERCTVTARIRVGGPHRAHGAAHADHHRRAADRAVAAAQGARRHRRSVRTRAHGQRALRRRALDDRPPHGAHRALAHANSAAQVRLPTLPSTGRAHGGPWRRRWKVLTIRSVFAA